MLSRLVRSVNIVLCQVVCQHSHVVLSVSLVMWSVNVVLCCAVCQCLSRAVQSVIAHVVWYCAVNQCRLV